MKLKFFKIKDNTWEVEILRVGTWNGNKFVTEDLQEIADNFNKFSKEIQVPLKFGHDMDQNLIGQSDGDPAIGWVSELRVTDGRLVATFTDVPDIVVNLIEAKRYKNVSVELVSNVKVGDERVGEVLIGVALLGADQPAVSGLQDLQTFLTDDTFKSLHLKDDSNVKEFEYSHNLKQATKKDVNKSVTGKELSMTEEEIAAMKAEAEKNKKELSLLKEKNDALVKQNEESVEAIRLSSFNGSKETFAAKLESLVKEGKTTPAAVEEINKELESQVKTYSVALGFSFSEALVLKLLSMGSVKMDKKETANGDSDNDNPDLANTPDVLVMRKAKEFVLSDKVKNMSEGMAMVFEQDPELKKQYMKFTESPIVYQEEMKKGA